MKCGASMESSCCVGIGGCQIPSLIIKVSCLLTLDFCCLLTQLSVIPLYLQSIEYPFTDTNALSSSELLEVKHLYPLYAKPWAEWRKPTMPKGSPHWHALLVHQHLPPSSNYTMNSNTMRPARIPLREGEIMDFCFLSSQQPSSKQLTMQCHSFAQYIQAL